jgi:hypothetical protein
MEPVDHEMYRAAIHGDTEAFEMVIRKMSRPLFAIAFGEHRPVDCAPSRRPFSPFSLVQRSAIRLGTDLEVYIPAVA